MLTSHGRAAVLAASLAVCGQALAGTPAPTSAGGMPPAASVTCDPSIGLEPSDKILPHVSEALRDGKRLDILAVGSATMLGPHMAVPGSFPARTAQLLQAARPATDVRLFTHAERGASAVELLAILRREIVAHPASLVLWQTGTAEAATNGSPAAFEATLQEGVRAALAAGSDIVLIDPPFSRLLSSRADLERYNELFREAVSPPGAALFSRYTLTRHWVTSGELDLERAVAGERSATLARLHECLAKALSQALLAAAVLPDPTAASR